MTTNNFKLTDDEISLIVDKRAAKDEIKVLEAKRIFDRDEKLRLAAEKKSAAVVSLIDSLRKADTNNITFQTKEDGDQVFFLLNGNPIKIEIEEQWVASSGWHRHSRGLKYRISGGFNNYSRRFYSNAKSVIKKIAALQDEAIHLTAVKLQKADLAGRSLEALRDDYPNATVTFEAGYNYGTGRTRQVEPNRYKVETDNGSYTFTSHFVTGQRNQDDSPSIQFDVYNRTISKNLDDEVWKMILG